MRAERGLLAVAVTLALVGCAGTWSSANDVVPSNAYIGEDIAAARSADAGDLRDKRPFEPGHGMLTFHNGPAAPSDFYRR